MSSTTSFRQSVFIPKGENISYKADIYATQWRIYRENGGKHATQWRIQ